MCIKSQNTIDNLPVLNKALANKTLVDIQLVFGKAGGKVTRKDLLNMSLENFICLCSMNQISIDLK